MTLKTLFSAGALIALGMLAGRVLGLLRETLLAASFGTGGVADIAIALLIIPDFLTQPLIGNAFGATLVPAFAARDENNALALFWQAFVSTVIVFVLIALLIYSQSHDMPYAFLLALCSLPLTAATAVAMAWLQYHHRFLI